MCPICQEGTMVSLDDGYECDECGFFISYEEHFAEDIANGLFDEE